jgi:hypothetical protein
LAMIWPETSATGETRVGLSADDPRHCDDLQAPGHPGRMRSARPRCGLVVPPKFFGRPLGVRMGWILWGIVLPLLVVVAGIVALQKRRSGRR